EEITEVILSSENISLQKGETKQIRATVLPLNASQEVTWVSGNESVVRVKDGLLTAVSSGTTTVAAVAKNGMIDKMRVSVQYSPIDYEIGSNVMLYMYSDTLRVSLTKYDGYYLTRVWMANPGNQIHKIGGLSLNTVPSMIGSAASAYDLNNKIVVAINGSGFHNYTFDNDPQYNGTAIGNLVITEGQILRNNIGYEEHQWAKYYYYIINQYGELKIAGNRSSEESHNNIINNIGAVNTFAFYPVYFADNEQWAIWNTGTARRQGFCQIDGNNYAIVTSSMNGTLPMMNNIFINLGCKTAVNTDGGGSTSLLFKNRGQAFPGNVVIGGVRAVADTLFFTEG
ncbi:MAG: Ig-like domain-containing protein, partial [Bacilli bacterium]|nr:Ig-like domain-containing protein [Bacilli bacterium]